MNNWRALSWWLGGFGVVAASFLAGIGGGMLARHLSPQPDISYADFIVIILTLLAVILAGLTLFIGIFAILGWTAISSGASKRAEQVISKELSEEGTLYKLVRIRVEEIMYQGVSSVEGKTPEDGEDSDA